MDRLLIYLYPTFMLREPDPCAWFYLHTTVTELTPSWNVFQQDSAAAGEKNWKLHDNRTDATIIDHKGQVMQCQLGFIDADLPFLYERTSRTYLNHQCSDHGTKSHDLPWHTELFRRSINLHLGFWFSLVDRRCISATPSCQHRRQPHHRRCYRSMSFLTTPSLQVALDLLDLER